VLLDEPTANLDAEGVAALEKLLKELRALGGSAVVADHAGWRLGRGLSRWTRLKGGALAPAAAPEPPTPPAATDCGEGPVVLRAEDLTVSRGGARPLLEGAVLELRAGEVVAISGPNGVGKSTLARVLAGLHRPDAGRVERQGHVALMLPGAELQLFATTVAEEVAAAGVGREERTRVLRRHRLESLAARAPWTLSRGERQRLVHAALDIIQPAALVVDEPGQGLDPEDLLSLVELIHRRQSRGRAYVLITHRRELALAAHRHLEIVDRQLVPTEPGLSGGGFEG
jgi:energy-coupling factor transport system ATP-binding protein